MNVSIVPSSGAGLSVPEICGRPACGGTRVRTLSGGRGWPSAALPLSKEVKNNEYKDLTIGIR